MATHYLRLQTSQAFTIFKYKQQGSLRVELTRERLRGLRRESSPCLR